MEIFYVIAPWIIIISGIMSVISGLVIFLSCRCIAIWKFSKKLMNNESFKKFFQKHCNIWWIFWALVIVHAIVAWLYFFSPF